jgi:hypothetical protein
MIHSKIIYVPMIEEFYWRRAPMAVAKIVNSLHFSNVTSKFLRSTSRAMSIAGEFKQERNAC